MARCGDGLDEIKAAPSFSLARGAWVPRVVTWDAATGEFKRLERPESLADYGQAVEASRFLARAFGVTPATLLT